MARKHKMMAFGKESTKGSVGSILSNFFMRIMGQLGVDTTSFDRLIRRYIQKALLDPNRVERATARASLGKDLLKSSMTWKTFIKGLAFLSVLKFDLNVRLYHANGEVTNHQYHIVLDDIDFENLEKEEDSD